MMSRPHHSAHVAIPAALAVMFVAALELLSRYSFAAAMTLGAIALILVAVRLAVVLAKK